MTYRWSKFVLIPFLPLHKTLLNYDCGQIEPVRPRHHMGIKCGAVTDFQMKQPHGPRTKGLTQIELNEMLTN